MPLIFAVNGKINNMDSVCKVLLHAVFFFQITDPENSFEKNKQTWCRKAFRVILSLTQHASVKRFMRCTVLKIKSSCPVCNIGVSLPLFLFSTLVCPLNHSWRTGLMHRCTSSSTFLPMEPTATTKVTQWQHGVNK